MSGQKCGSICYYTRMYHVVHRFPYEAERLCYFENRVLAATSEADTCDSCNYSGDIRVTAVFRDRGAAQRCSERFAQLEAEVRADLEGAEHD